MRLANLPFSADHLDERVNALLALQCCGKVPAQKDLMNKATLMHKVKVSWHASAQCSCTQVTYLLALADEAWESLGKVELKKRRAWLANLAATWAATLYGQQHEETRVWEARCLKVKEEEGFCEMPEKGREVPRKREPRWNTGGRKRNFRAHGRLKRHR